MTSRPSSIPGTVRREADIQLFHTDPKLHKWRAGCYETVASHHHCLHNCRTSSTCKTCCEPPFPSTSPRYTRQMPIPKERCDDADPRPLATHTETNTAQ